MHGYLGYQEWSVHHESHARLSWSYRAGPGAWAHLAPRFTSPFLLQILRALCQNVRTVKLVGVQVSSERRFLIG